MYRLYIALLVVGAMLTPGVRPASAQGAASCADFDAWEWAQSVFESDPDTNDSLDPDGDGIACPELAKGGFAPAFWTDTLPANLEEVELNRIVDGDTLEVLIDGVTNRVRIYRADTPETQNEQHCGGQEATNYTAFALGFNDNGSTLYLERDETLRDQFGRELAYVWFEVDGQPYMLNHILINNGWADDVDYGDRKYDDQLKDAAAFGKRHDLGVWGLCGGFDIPIEQAPEEPAPPVDSGDGGSGNGDGGGDGNGDDGGDGGAYVPPVQEPTAEPEPAPDNSGCHPSYSPCVPDVGYDLDCGEIGYGVTVTGPDEYGLDADNDGYGCESY